MLELAFADLVVAKGEGEDLGRRESKGLPQDVWRAFAAWSQLFTHTETRFGERTGSDSRI